MNKNIFMTGIILISLLGLTGCLPTSTEVDYRMGTEGLVLSIEGADEILIYQNDFAPYENYEIKVENKGATSIEEGSSSSSNGIYMRIQMSEFLKEKDSEKNKVSLRSLNDIAGYSITTLEGKTRYGTNGEYISHFLDVLATAPPNQGVQANIKVDLCYSYKTVLSDSVCIENHVMRQNKGCKQKEYSYSSGQGAPIKISSIEIKYNLLEDDKVTPKVIFKVENDEGDIVSLAEGTEFMQGCLSQQNLNKIKLVSAKLGANSLSCDTEDNDIIELEDNEKIIVCELQGSSEDTPEGYFDSPLYIELEYGYHTSEVMEIDIIRENYS